MTSPGGTSIKQGRIHSLDGLRGLAAGIVLLHHSLLVFPLLAAPYFNGVADRRSVEWWLVNTPLHLIWDGTSAVYVFFILSGLVLARPVYATARAFDWKAFYPQRLIRLYVPVWAAVAFAVGTFILVPRRPAMESAWLQAMPSHVTPERVVMDVTLLLGNGWLASPLWSLRWEIIFSLLLPLYMWVAYRLRRHPLLAISACLVAVAIGGAIDQSALRYLPMFAIGVLIGPLLEQPTSGTPRGRSASWVWAVALGGGLLLLVGRWIAPTLVSTSVGSGIALALAAAGAALIVACATIDGKVKRFLTTRPLLWLGKISFSLYLIHEPIVITTAHIFGNGREYIAVPVAIIVAIFAGWLFFRFVEVPSYALAKKVGHLVRSPLPVRTK